ncbi:PAS domain S-box protein [Nannocystaceae bacterium ST9]
MSVRDDPSQAEVQSARDREPDSPTRGGESGSTSTNRTDAEELIALREQLAVAREHLDVFSQLTSGYWWLAEVQTEGIQRRGWVTRSFARSTGYAAEDIGRVDAEQLVHPEDVEVFRTTVGAVVRGSDAGGREQAVHEFRMFARDGSLMWVRQRLEGRGQGVGRRIYASGELITERKRTEDALGHVEARFLSLVEHAPNVIVTSDRDGTILFVNRRMPGDHREPWELIGGSVFELGDEIGGQRMRDAIAEIVAEGGNRDFSAEPIRAWEFELRGRPGREPTLRVVAGESASAPVEPRWYEVQAAPVIRSREIVAITMILTDITERRQAEQALRRSESRWRFLWENVPDRISELDAEGRIVVTNRALGQRPAASMFGNSVFDYLGPDASHALRRAMDIAKRSGEPSSYEIVVRESDPRGGQRSETWWSNRVVPYVEGEARGFLLIGTDISDRKAAERERTNLEAQLRQQQKLESIGTLASGVAHEINNPIQSIMNYADLVRARVREDEPVAEFANEIVVETERVASIVRSLLAFARQEKEHHSPARLCDIVESSLTLMRAVLRRDHIHLEVDVPADLPKIKCRSQQIQQVFMNLVANSRDALNAKYPEFDDDKQIRIASRVFEHEGETWVRTTVEDHGIGIPSEIIDRVYDPFFTTKGRDSGTGLGLSVSHGIVREHRGAMGVESKMGEYTRFFVDLRVDNGWGFVLEDYPAIGD